MPEFMSPEQRAAMNRVMREVEFERMEQHFKWGEQSHPNAELLPGEIEFFRDVSQQAKANTDEAAKTGKLSYKLILEEEWTEVLAALDDPEQLRMELVQVAAVAVAWVEAIDRRKDSA